MADQSDEEQAVVFYNLLSREIDDVSNRIESTETHSRSAQNRDDVPTHQQHSAHAAALRSTLYELHRQQQALRTRFPSVLAPTRDGSNSQSAQR